VNLLSSNPGLRDFIASYNSVHDTVTVGGSAANVAFGGLTVRNAGSAILSGVSPRQFQVRQNGRLYMVSGAELVTNSRHLDLYGVIDSLSQGYIVSDAASRLRVFGESSAIGLLRFKPGANVVKSLKLNRNSSGNIRLGTPLTVLDTLVMNDGILFTSESALLSLSENAVLSGFGSNTNYIDGPLKKSISGGSSSFVYPLGRSGRFRPLTITNLAGTAEGITAEYFANGPGSSYSLSNSDGMEVKNEEYWMINSDNPVAPDGLVQLTWGAESGLTPEENILMKLRIASWNASVESFASAGPAESNAQGTEETGTVESDATPLSGPFTFGVLNQAALPVELLEFGATAREHDVLLNWTTVSEINNDYFEVYRSVDAENFVPIGRVTGAGNSNHVINYELPDPDAMHLGAEIIYYKLHQVDFNGAFSDSEIIPVQINAGSSFTLVHAGFPSGNSLTGSFTTEAGGIVELMCFDLNGRLVAQQKINATAGVNSFSAQAHTDLAQGVYTVQLIFNGQIQTAKVPKAF
ncbi:MAG: T9SS type A sorting domain-containing protein, partial [Bacteroidetes bacterium]|nr:T9SS type A sorting domain-containing protein [Bacteroidota bacterium]